MSSLNFLASTSSQNVVDVQKEIVQIQVQVRGELSSEKKSLDPEEVGIVMRLSAQVLGDQNVTSDIKQRLDLLSVTGTALSSATTILSQMKDVATQSTNAGLTTSGRAALNSTFGQLSAQVSSLLKGATVNNTNLIDSSTFMADASIATGDQVAQTGLTSTRKIPVSSTALDAGVDAAVAAAVAAVVAAFGGGGEAAARATLATAVAAAAAAGKLNIGTLSIGMISDTTEQGQAKASCAIDILTVALNTISNRQSIVDVEQIGLKAQSPATLSLATNFLSTIDSAQNIHETSLQAQLQQLNDQQSLDYDPISQMNTAAAATLTIFR